MYSMFLETLDRPVNILEHYTYLPVAWILVISSTELVLITHEADPSGGVRGVLLFVGEYVEFTVFTVRVVVGGNRLTSVVHATDFGVELNDSGDQLYF